MTVSCVSSLPKRIASCRAEEKRSPPVIFPPTSKHPEGNRYEYRPRQPRHRQSRRARQERSCLAANGNSTSLSRDPQGHRRHVVGFLRLGGRRVVEGTAT